MEVTGAAAAITLRTTSLLALPAANLVWYFAMLAGVLVAARKVKSRVRHFAGVFTFLRYDPVRSSLGAVWVSNDDLPCCHACI